MPTTEFLAGILLALTTLLPGAVGLGLRLTGRPVSNAPFEDWPGLARAMRWTISVWIVVLLLGLLGFTLLTRLLTLAGDPGMGSFAFVLLTLGTVLAIVEGTHHMTLGIWSAEEAARTGTRPPFTEPLSRWTSVLQTLFYLLWMGGLAVYGGGLLLSGFLPVWAGGTALAWGAFWLAAFGVRRVEWTWGVTAPVPLVIGAALLLPG